MRNLKRVLSLALASVMLLGMMVIGAGAADKTAADLTDMDKVTAIYNYIAGHYTYDTKLANDITSGKVSKYIPDTAATLNSNKGICYDLASLFAAMCRSQDIPCTLTKGYAGSSYHAWNKVNVSGNWYQIDMTYAVTKRVINETTFAGCVSPLTYTQQSDTLAVSAVA